MSVRMIVPIRTSLSGLVTVKCYVIVRSGTYTIRVEQSVPDIMLAQGLLIFYLLLGRIRI
jgi:hypothetical protein